MKKLMIKAVYSLNIDGQYIKPDETCEVPESQAHVLVAQGFAKLTTPPAVGNNDDRKRKRLERAPS